MTYLDRNPSDIPNQLHQELTSCATSLTMLDKHTDLVAAWIVVAHAYQQFQQARIELLSVGQTIESEDYQEVCRLWYVFNASNAYKGLGIPPEANDERIWPF